MDTTMAMTRLEGAIQQQVIVAGGDPEVESAARAILAALEPAVRQMAYDLAEQAAAEMTAQLPGHQIDVVLVAGEPTLRVRTDPGGTWFINTRLASAQHVFTFVSRRRMPL